MPNKYKTYGAAFQRLIAAAWTDVAQVDDVGEIDVMRDTIETTTHDTGGFRTHVGHVRDIPPIDVHLLFDPVEAGHLYFLTEVENGNNENGEAFRFVFADGTTWEITCIVTHFKVDSQPIDGKLAATITLKPSGAPDLSPV